MIRTAWYTSITLAGWSLCCTAFAHVFAGCDLYGTIRLLRDTCSCWHLWDVGDLGDLRDLCDMYDLYDLYRDMLDVRAFAFITR